MQLFTRDPFCQARRSVAGAAGVALRSKAASCEPRLLPDRRRKGHPGDRLLLCPPVDASQPPRFDTLAPRKDTRVVHFEYTRSQGAHGHHRIGVFDAFVGSQREIWAGSDGSGLIRESRGPVSFFTDAGRADWEAAGSPVLDHGPSVDLFAPGCLGGSRIRRARLARDPDGLITALKRQTHGLHDVQELLGEAAADAAFCETVYTVACDLPGVELIRELGDQLGRAGRGLARAENKERIQLIFAADLSELLGYQRFLAEPQPFAPAGALHSWSAFLERTLVQALPDNIPPIPTLPCEPPFAGRGFPIRPGFSVMTGYVTDAVEQLAKLRGQGIITHAEYDTARTYQVPR